MKQIASDYYLAFRLYTSKRKAREELINYYTKSEEAGSFLLHYFQDHHPPEEKTPPPEEHKCVESDELDSLIKNFFREDEKIFWKIFKI